MPETADNIIPEAFRSDIERAVEILKEGGCSEIFLFGSLAEGRSRENSDIDLAVRGCPPRDFFRLLGRLLTELKHSVDLVDLDENSPFSRFLQKEGTLIRVG
jgi:predicted nucleotidyltransferase